MSQTLFAELQEKETPKFNRHIADGIATYYMQFVDIYIDRILRGANSFPEGLKYLGYEKCTPEEEYIEATRVKNNRRLHDLAISDLTMNKYYFEFNGEKLPPRYFYVPHCREAGICYIGGTMNHFLAIVSDKVISPGADSVFVRLLKDKIIFRRCYHPIRVNLEEVENVYVTYAPIYRRTKEQQRQPMTTKANTCLVHYLLGKYGFTEMFKRYVGYVPIVGDETTINHDNYSKTDWVIVDSFFYSNGTKPKGFIMNNYNSTKLRLAVPKDKYTQQMQYYISGFFYTVDHFPERIGIKSINNIALYKILLGHIIFSGTYGENKLFQSVTDHYGWLDDYVDAIVQEKLDNAGYSVKDFYDVLDILVSNFSSFLLDTDSNNDSMYHKTMEVLYYVLYSISSSIYTLNYNLARKAARKKLTTKDVIDCMSKKLRPGMIYSLSNSSGSVIMDLVSYSGDNKFPKITATIKAQEAFTSQGKRTSRRVVGAREHLDVSQCEVGNVLMITKANPSPIGKVNPFMHIDLRTGGIVRNPKLIDILTQTDHLLKGRNIDGTQMEQIEELFMPTFEDSDIESPE